MTSFVTAFGSSDYEVPSSNNTAIHSNNHQEINSFSNIDLDQQATPTHEPSSSGHDRNGVETLRVYPSLAPGSSLHGRASWSKGSSLSASASIDRRVSMPDVARLSASSVAAVTAMGPKFDKFKQWSRSTYKCTKQSIYEKLGKSTRTVDAELDGQIELFRETKRRYENMLALARSYANHFYNLMQTQRGLSEQFFELKQKSAVLSDEFGYNAQTQHLLVQNGEILFNALNYFIATLNTLCTKTMEDTLSTIRSYETARLEYDACRTEIQFLSAGVRLNEKQEELERYKDKYEQLKCSVNVKLKLLEENQVKVMKTQLLFFHNAIAAYFSGNKDALESTMKQFNLKFTSSTDNHQDKESFLEQSRQ